MATLIEIQDCSYEYWNDLRKKLMKYNRFGFHTGDYVREDNYGTLWVHDAKYIPLEFYELETAPDFNRPKVTIWVTTEFRENIVQAALQWKKLEKRQ